MLCIWGITSTGSGLFSVGGFANRRVVVFTDRGVDSPAVEAWVACAARATLLGDGPPWRNLLCLTIRLLARGGISVNRASGTFTVPNAVSHLLSLVLFAKITVWADSGS